MTRSRYGAAVTSLVLGVTGTWAVLGDWWIYLGLAVAGVISALLIFAQPLNGLLAWILLDPEVGRYAQINLPSGIPDITFSRAAVGLVTMGLVLSAVFNKKNLLPIGKVERAMIVFLAIIYIDIGRRSRNAASDALVGLDEYGIPFLLFYLARHLFRDREDATKFFSVITLLGVILAGHGIYQYATYGSAGSAQVALSSSSDELLKEGGHIKEGRALGPYTNAMTFGAVVATAFVWGLFLALHQSRGLLRLALLVALAIIATSGLLSLTRAVWLGLLLAILAIAVLDRYWRSTILISLAAASLCGVLVALALPKNVSAIQARATQLDTIEQRIVMYRAAFFMILDRPLLGYGRGERRFVEARQKYLKPVGSIPAEMGNRAGPPHNIYLYTTIQWGLVGLVGYLAVFTHVILSALKLRSVAPGEDSFEHRFSSYFLASTILYLSFGLFVDSVALPFIAATYFVGGGIMASLLARRAKELSSIVVG